MLCPVCDEKLREVEKYGVMVDICPGCKGVWLDRGELEKIVSLDARDEGGLPHREERDERHDDHNHQADRGNWGEHKQGKPKKRSFLSDLMEGFGD
jgi:uncharacterized protein